VSTTTELSKTEYTECEEKTTGWYCRLNKKTYEKQTECISECQQTLTDISEYKGLTSMNPLEGAEFLGNPIEFLAQGHGSN